MNLWQIFSVSLCTITAFLLIFGIILDFLKYYNAEQESKRDRQTLQHLCYNFSWNKNLCEHLFYKNKDFTVCVKPAFHEYQTRCYRFYINDEYVAYLIENRRHSFSSSFRVTFGYCMNVKNKEEVKEVLLAYSNELDRAEQEMKDAEKHSYFDD